MSHDVSRWVVGLLWTAGTICLPALSASARPTDAGVATDGRTDGPPDAALDGRREAGPLTDGGLRPDAEVITAEGWPERQLQSLTILLDRLREQQRTVGGLEPTAVTPPAALAKLFPGDLHDPAVTTQLIKTLERQRLELAGQAAEHRQRTAGLRPVLEEPGARLAALEKRRQRRKQLRLPDGLEEEVAHARRRLELLALEGEVLDARLALLDTQVLYLRASQPERIKAKLAESLGVQAERAGRQASAKAQAEEQSAETARKAALVAQRRARSEAERLLAGERARLEDVRGQQARLKDRLGKEQVALAQLRVELERFRGGIAARVDALRPDWPRSAAGFDALFDQVVTRLITLRPDAVRDLTSAIKGLPDPPDPGERLGERLRQLDQVFKEKVAALEELRQQLARARDDLEEKQRAILLERLALLQREVTWLNEHRIQILARVTPAKHDRLTGVTRETLQQLSREFTQLVLDGLYYAFRRLQQLDQVPRLIIDIFTVGSLLWGLIKLVLLILLVRFALRRWERWLGVAVQRITRSATLGRNALRLAKLLDALRSSGPALIVLLAAVIAYQILGGLEAAAEFQVLYTVFFWIAIYRIQLRLVETGARYMGIEEPPRGAEHEELEEEIEGEEGQRPTDLHRPVTGPLARAQRPTGPHPPLGPAGSPAAELPPATAEDGAATAAQQAAGTMAVQQTASATAAEEAPARVVTPAPVLLVRSVRAATRYILVVILVLELTALAVGKGTYYGLTAKFSWYAAFPFIFYFLQLWRPHIARAHRTLARGKQARGSLARLVETTHDRFYGVFVVGVAFFVVLGNRLALFARRYLTSLDATKKLLAFFFRKQVEKQAEQRGRVAVRWEDLPQAIRDQFPMGPLQSRHDPLRLPVLDEIKAAHARWTAERSDGSTALVGRFGVGKTTLLSQLEAELGVPVLYGGLTGKLTDSTGVVRWLGGVFGFDPLPTTEDELIRLIREDTRPAIALDNCHNLFLRRVGGFDGWECFLRVVNQTCDNLFWLIVFNQSAWEYLNNISGRFQYFRQVIALPAWSEDQIRRMIMKRMRRARHAVSFSDLVVAQLEGASMAAQLGRTSAGYFRLLWSFTDGNPRLASHFWLDSLVPVKGRREVRVQLFDTPNIDALEALSDDILFALTAVTEHQNLTVAETVATTNLSLDFCNFALRFCLEEGYLWHDPESGRYRLSRRWQQPIMRFLKRQHLLHS